MGGSLYFGRGVYDLGIIWELQSALLSLNDALVLDSTSHHLPRPSGYLATHANSYTIRHAVYPSYPHALILILISKLC